MWPDEGARILLDEPFGLGFAPVMYDSELDDRCHAISFSYGPSTIVTKHAIPGLPSLPDQPAPDEEEAYLAKVSHIVQWL